MRAIFKTKKKINFLPVSTSEFFLFFSAFPWKSFSLQDHHSVTHSLVLSRRKKNRVWREKKPRRQRFSTCAVERWRRKIMESGEETRDKKEKKRSVEEKTERQSQPTTPLATFHWIFQRKKPFLHHLLLYRQPMHFFSFLVAIFLLWWQTAKRKKICHPLKKSTPRSIFSTFYSFFTVLLTPRKQSFHRDEKKKKRSGWVVGDSKR